MASSSRELCDEQVLDALEEESAECSDSTSEISIGYSLDSNSEESEDPSHFSVNFQGNNWQEIDSADPPPPFACELLGKQILPVPCIDDPLAYFELFFDDEIISIIVTETNRYAAQFLAREKEKITQQKKSRFQKWVPTTLGEIRVYLGLLMLMGIIQKPSLRMYFCRKHLLETPFFPNVMSEQRFSLLSKFLHFVDNTDEEVVRKDPKLHKILPISEYLKNKFQKVYIPGKEISVDESLLLWKGRLSWKQYIPMKASRFGIKLFELCDSAGYLWNFIIYCGSGTKLGCEITKDTDLFSTKVVLSLCEKLLDSGRCVYMDNFYSSPDLFQRLVQRTTDAVGTVKITRKGMPVNLKKKLKKGEVVSAKCGKLVALKWKDKRDVALLTTKHSDQMQPVSRKGGLECINKPMCVIEYNKYMGGVDLKDQLLESFLLERKRTKVWYKKLFNHFVNTAVLNAYILHRKAGNNKDHLEFRISLVNKIIAKYHGQNLDQRKGRPSDIDTECTRLTGQHFVQQNPPTETFKVGRRKCVVCTKNGKRKETRYRCKNYPGTPHSA